MTLPAPPPRLRSDGTREEKEAMAEEEEDEEAEAAEAVLLSKMQSRKVTVTFWISFETFKYIFIQGSVS